MALSVGNLLDTGCEKHRIQCDFLHLFLHIKWLINESHHHYSNKERKIQNKIKKNTLPLQSGCFFFDRVGVIFGGCRFLGRGRFF